MKKKYFAVTVSVAVLCLALFSNTLFANQAAIKNSQDECECQTIPWQQSFDNSLHVVFGEVKTIESHGDELATGEFTAKEVF